MSVEDDEMDAALTYGRYSSFCVEAWKSESEVSETFIWLAEVSVRAVITY